MNNRIGYLTVGMFVAASACSDPSNGDQDELKTSALSSTGWQWMNVPAYYSSGPDGTPSWNSLTYDNDLEHVMAVGFAIVNAQCEATSGGPLVCNGGPLNNAGAIDTALQARINTLSNNFGIYVLGYVSFRHGRNTNDVIADINSWASYGNMTGIFFDQEGNTRSASPSSAEIDSYTAHAKWAADQVVTHQWSPYAGVGRSMFNFGYTAQWMARFVNCTSYYQNAFNYYVSEETFYSIYHGIPDTAVTTDANYQWLASYSPLHFSHLVHDVDSNGSTVAEVVAKSAKLNAQQIYVTDRQQAQNAWNPIAGWTVWSTGAGIIDYQQNGHPVTFPGGGGQDPTPSPSCPASSVTEL